MSQHNEKKKKGSLGAALAKGVLRTSGKSFSIHILDESWVDEIHALHTGVYDGLKPHQKTFLGPRSKESFAEHLQSGGMILGVVCDGVLVAKSVISLSANDDGTTSTKIQSNTVMREYQGNGLMQYLVKTWIALSLAAGHATAEAEVDVLNTASIKNLFNAGLSVVNKEVDSSDGGDIYKMKAPVKEAALKCVFNKAANDNEEGPAEKLSDVEIIVQRLKEGYKGVGIRQGRMVFKRVANG